MTEKNLLAYILIIIITLCSCILIVPISTPIIEEIYGIKMFEEEDPTEVSVLRTYFDEELTSFSTTSEDSWEEIPNLAIDFQVGSIESMEKVYVLFTCNAIITPNDNLARMHFNMYLDGDSDYNTGTTIGVSNTAVTHNMYYSVTLQRSLSSLLVGNHTITIKTIRECPGHIDTCRLLIQIYK